MLAVVGSIEAEFHVENSHTILSFLECIKEYGCEIHKARLVNDFHCDIRIINSPQYSRSQTKVSSYQPPA